MCNIYNINGEVFSFELYNLNYFQDCDTEISGHYTFWWHKPTNKYVFCKHGDYYNLTSILPVKEEPRFPSEKEFPFLEELITKIIRHAYFYNRDASCNHGRYLLDDLELRCEKHADGLGTEWFKHDHDEYLDNVMKINCIFDVEYPGPDYKVDQEYWDEQKRKDKLATELLGSNFELYFKPGSSWITEKYLVRKVDDENGKTNNQTRRPINSKIVRPKIKMDINV